MAKLLAVDLDGTLFYPKHLTRCISRRNCHFLRRWIDEGNKLVLITSRSHEYTERLNEEIGRPYDVINCTSCQIYHDGELIRNHKLNNNEIKTILAEIEEKYHPIAFLLTTRDQPCAIKNCGRASRPLLICYLIYWFFQFKYREHYVMDNEVFANEIEHGDVYKVMVFFGLAKNKNKISKEINKKLREEYPEVESSWVSIVNDITPKDCNKGAGLEYYVQATNTDPNDVYVVGDSGNDISMFQKYHEHSYCMKHAYPSVKKYAKHTISRVFKLEKVLKGENHE